MTNPLTPADVEKFKRFGISPALLAEAGVFRVNDADARTCGFRYSPGSNLSGLVFPYYDPIRGVRVTARLRRDKPDLDENEREKAKYIFPYGDNHHLYFPPAVSTLLADVTVPVVFVEAEKSALAAYAWAIRTGRSLLPIATGGCYGWRSKVGIVEGANGERNEIRGPHPDLGLLRLEQRGATVLFDTNAATNTYVHQARWRFAHELDTLGAKVLIADIPIIEGVNGPDDLLAIKGGDQALAKVLDSARLLPEYAVREATRIIDAWPPKFSTTEEMMESRKILLDALARIPRSEDRDALLRPAAKLIQEPLRSIRGAVATRVARLQKSQREWQEAARVVERQTVLASRNVNPGDLIDKLQAFFSKRKYSPDGTPLVEALFTMNSYVFDVFDTTPYLSYDSAVPGCGKSVSLEHLEAVGNRAYLGVAPTTATLFRKIDRDTPTWLLDEAAVLQAKNGDMAPVIAILTAGYKKGATVPRCEGENGHYTLRDFNVYCPKAFARIGALKGALRDRCIQVHMEKAPGKVPKTKPKFLKKEAEPLKKDLEAYALKFRSELQKLYEEEPEDGYWPQLQGREEELWLPLLMHAKLAGPQYEEKALAVALKFSQAKQANAIDDEKSFALAQELIEVLKEYAEDQFSPGDLVSDLEKKECWGEAFAKLNHLKAKAGSVGRFLHRFRLSSRERTNKGTSYNREEAIEVIMRHTPTGSATSATEAGNTGISHVAGANFTTAAPGSESDHGSAQQSTTEGWPAWSDGVETDGGWRRIDEGPPLADPESNFWEGREETIGEDEEVI